MQAARSGGGRDGPFVGRERELAMAERALPTRELARPGVIEVTGEPGIGKTRLLDELMRTAARRGCAVARGWAGDLERDVPYGVLTHALDALLEQAWPRLAGVLGAAHAAELGAVFPSLPGRHIDPGPQLGVERYRLFAAVRAALTLLAKPRPLVVALDDLHWADGGSTELVGYLLRRPPQGAVLLVLAYRPRQASVALTAAVDATPGTIRIPLGPLSAAAADSLAAWLGPEMAPAVRAGLYAASGGNPFYLQALARSGSTGAAAPAETDQRDRVEHAVHRELDMLPPHVREVASFAAVVGDVIRPEILAAVAQVPERRVLAALDELTARDLVRETDVPGELRFRHPVLQEVVYGSVPPGRRLAAHRRAATVLEARGVPLVERAYHVERAATPGDAAAAGLLADAAAATVPRAPATAVRWYEAALRLLPDREDASGTRLELLLAYTHALVTAGRLPDAADVLVRARALPAADDRAVDAWLVALIGQAYNLLGRHDRAADLITATLATMPAMAGREAVALTVELAQVAFWRRHYDAMLVLAEAAVAGAQSLGPDPVAADAAAQRAFADYQLGRTAAALSHLTAAAATVDALPDEALAGRVDVLSHLGHTENVLGRENDALRHLDRGLAIARHTGHGYVPLAEVQPHPVTAAPGSPGGRRGRGRGSAGGGPDARQRHVPHNGAARLQLGGPGSGRPERRRRVRRAGAGGGTRTERDGDRLRGPLPGRGVVRPRCPRAGRQCPGRRGGRPGPRPHRAVAAAARV